MLTGSYNGMGINLKTISLSITGIALTVFISTAAIAASVDISYQGTGTSTSLEIKGNGNKSVNAGLSAITVDGTNSLAVNTSNSSMDGTWAATVTSYADVQAGAGKYNKGERKDREKYAKAGYLFSLLDTSKDPSTVAKKYNALINYVIWDIFAKVPKLDNEDDKDAAEELEDRAKDYKKFDWSATMVVYTGADGKNQREFFAVLPPIATPIPSALFLFGSMALGLFGIVTRKQATSA
jgi:hypothetical protein